MHKKKTLPNLLHFKSPQKIRSKINSTLTFIFSFAQTLQNRTFKQNKRKSHNFQTTRF